MEKIKVCADPFPPYQYIDKDGQMRGRDYELVMSRLRAAGYSPKMHIAPWNQIYPQFEDGEFDVLFQAQDSPERLEKFYLSRLLRHAVTEVVTVNRGLTGLRKYTELEGYKVGVIADFANGPEIDSLPASCKTEFADAAKVLQGIYDGTVDCGVCDQGVKEYLMAKEPALYPIPALTYHRPLYVMFRKKKHRDDFDAV
ncbi:hypothetical protein C817_03569 [Dorea sp. 5-2]|nr:hypothetical protein C817_03569 [Dorea sp. 5-2]